MAEGDKYKWQVGNSIYAEFEEFRISSGPTQGTWYTLSISGSGEMFASKNDFIEILEPGEVPHDWPMNRVVQDELVIGSMIETIASDTFRGLGEYYASLSNNEPGVKRIYIAGPIWKVGARAFQNGSGGQYKGIGQITILANITYIGEYAFGYQRWINGLRFRNTVKYCEAFAFYECNNLYYVDFADDWEAVNGGGSIFYNCYKLNVISPHNMIASPRSRNYYNCRYLTRMTIADPENFGRNYTKNGLYVELNTGNPDYLDPDGYLITEVAGLDNISGYDWETIWKRDFNRIYVVYVWHNNKVYLAHEGRWIEITMYESGDIPLAHEDVWWFLKWTQGVENPNHTPLYVAHNGHWYQVNY